jgi:ADP-ribosylglycohydrolase
MNDTVLHDKFRGALLGTMIGDALGAPVEGCDYERLNEILDNFINLQSPQRELNLNAFGMITGGAIPDGTARYTDDTQMTLTVKSSLACRSVIARSVGAPSV